MKIKANLLKFDTIDRIRVSFPKECNINIPDYVPITHPNKDSRIGRATSIVRVDSGLMIEGVIMVEKEMSDAIRKLANDKNIYVGGYYRINKEHDEDGVRVIDDMNLVSVGLYLDDIYGDDYTSLEVITDEQHD